MSSKVSSTIGFERAHNSLLTERDADAFVARILEELPPQPPSFERIVTLNRDGEPRAPVALPALSPRQVEAKRAAGALLVDVRTDREYDDGHVPEAVCIPILHQGFGTRLGWIADADREVVLIGRDASDGQQAAELCAAVGIDRLGGYLDGGITSWRDDARAVARFERIDPAELARRLERDPEPQVVDVRELGEWRAGHIPGSLHAPYRDLSDVAERLDPTRPAAVVCSSGQRSATAAGLLRNCGVESVVHVADGGVPTYEATGAPIERGDAVPSAVGRRAR